MINNEPPRPKTLMFVLVCSHGRQLETALSDFSHHRTLQTFNGFQISCSSNLTPHPTHTHVCSFIFERILLTQAFNFGRPIRSLGLWVFPLSFLLSFLFFFG